MIRQHRLILNTDAANEADDQFAIVHALLSPTIKIEGLIAAHFGDHRSATSMQDSRAEIELLLDLLGTTTRPLVVDGAPAAMTDAQIAVDSDGSRLIVERAMSDDEEGSLFIAFLGPLTDMAAALIAEPRIADRPITVVWIGGPPYDGINTRHVPEFNLGNDITAANVVFASGVRVWQIPATVYRMVGVGYAELQEKVGPCGPLGAYLVEQLVRWNDKYHPEPIEHRSLGDSPAIGVVLNPDGAIWRERPAVTFRSDGSLGDPVVPGRTVQVADSVDVRFLLEDMFAKLRTLAR